MPTKKTGRGPTREKVENVLAQIRPEYIEEGAKRVRPRDMRAAVARADELHDRFRHGAPLDRFKDDADQLIEVLADFCSGRYEELPYWTAAIITFALQYVLKPVDIIPDSLPMIGQLDDAVILSHCLLLVRSDLRAYRVWKLAEEVDGEG